MNNTILQYVFAGAGALWALLAIVVRGHRPAWATAATLAFVAAAAAHYDAFWLLAVAALGMVWALVCTSSTLDLAWRAKAGLVSAVALGAFLCMWPTLESLSNGKVHCPQYIKDHVERRLVAGLDLRGGLRLVYTVDVEEAIKDKRDRYFDEIRTQLARSYGFVGEDKPMTNEAILKITEKVDIEKVRNTFDSISVSFRDAGDIAKLDEKFSTRFSADLLRQPGGAPNQVVYRIRSSVESTIRETAVNQAKETIGRRVDELGLKEAAVSVRDEDIIIEVPGEDEKTFAEIREIIGKTARLEFKMVDDMVDFFGPMQKSATQDALPAGISFFAEKAPIGGGKFNTVTQARMVKNTNETMKQARERLREWISTLNPPADHEIGIGSLPPEVDEATGQTSEVGWRTYFLYAKAEVTGDQLVDAQRVPDQGNKSLGGWQVSFTFNQAGATRFAEITRANIEKRFAIVLDDNVESAPRIISEISGGSGVITMGSGDVNKQFEDSGKLELVLRSGALPAPIIPSNEQRIGASLGTDAIRQGIYGALAGSALVLLFMAVYYHVAGVVADIAVIFNLFLQLAVLATFGASMTLPGIAGLALTIGMAVDANVLINERIREELRQGKSPRAAVDVGYEKALSAIIDGHMTTFISGLILAQYGTGPIKGFAVTLLVGMVASLFTSVVCTRIAFDWWVRGRRLKTLNLGQGA